MSSLEAKALVEELARVRDEKWGNAFEEQKIARFTPETKFPYRGHIELTIHFARNIASDPLLGAKLVRLSFACGNLGKIQSTDCNWHQGAIHFGHQVLNLPLSTLAESSADMGLYLSLHYETMFGETLIGQVERIPIYHVVNQSFNWQWFALRKQIDDGFAFAGRLCVSLEYVGPVAITVLGARGLSPRLDNAFQSQTDPNNQPVANPYVFLTCGQHCFRTPSPIQASFSDPTWSASNTMFLPVSKLTHRLLQAGREAAVKGQISDPSEEPESSYGGLNTTEVASGTHALRVGVWADQLMTDVSLGHTYISFLTLIRLAQRHLPQPQALWFPLFQKHHSRQNLVPAGHVCLSLQRWTNPFRPPIFSIPPSSTLYSEYSPTPAPALSLSEATDSVSTSAMDSADPTSLDSLLRTDPNTPANNSANNPGLVSGGAGQMDPQDRPKPSSDDDHRARVSSDPPSTPTSTSTSTSAALTGQSEQSEPADPKLAQVLAQLRTAEPFREPDFDVHMVPPVARAVTQPLLDPYVWDPSQLLHPKQHRTWFPASSPDPLQQQCGAGGVMGLVMLHIHGARGLRVPQNEQVLVTARIGELSVATPAVTCRHGGVEWDTLCRFPVLPLTANERQEEKFLHISVGSNSIFPDVLCAMFPMSLMDVTRRERGLHFLQLYSCTPRQRLVHAGRLCVSVRFQSALAVTVNRARGVADARHTVASAQLGKATIHTPSARGPDPLWKHQNILYFNVGVHPGHQTEDRATYQSYLKNTQKATKPSSGSVNFDLTPSQNPCIFALRDRRLLNGEHDDKLGHDMSPEADLTISNVKNEHGEKKVEHGRVGGAVEGNGADSGAGSGSEIRPSSEELLHSQMLTERKQIEENVRNELEISQELVLSVSNVNMMGGRGEALGTSRVSLQRLLIQLTEFEEGAEVWYPLYREPNDKDKQFKKGVHKGVGLREKGPVSPQRIGDISISVRAHFFNPLTTVELNQYAQINEDLEFI